ncbi:alpha/beta hydrolase-fold protein [Clostridiaceae bacterium HSG29]|nr:alpha/beta hydrolase-fold protein [Clostridiaceae bacterium HSG29]
MIGQHSHSEIIIINHFYARKLDNYRSLRIYLPPSYNAQLDRRFPVLYTHDGQNMFNSEFSYSGVSWKIQNVADELIRQFRIEEIIIVAVDNMENERLNEYAHEDGSFNGQNLKGTGRLYEDFLINDVKPYIDANFKTLTDSSNTALMGSSMGGLVTFNIGIRNPNVFGKLGVISPSFWWGDGITLKKLKKNNINTQNEKLWIDMGDSEGYFMTGCNEVVNELLNKGYTIPENLVYYSVPGANHSESAWAQRVHCPLIYFFGQIGCPQELYLYGRDIVGIKGPKTHLNPVMYYNSGFQMTLLDAEFVLKDPDLLSVNEDGDIIPYKTGSTHIEVSKNGIKAIKKYVIIDELKKEVTITIHVTVPTETPDEILFLAIHEPQDFKLVKKGISTYMTQITLPRDEAISFKFTRGSWMTVEKDRFGGEIDSRLLKAEDDISVYYEVKKWADLK